MAMDFQAATKALFERVTQEDLAGELGCSVSSVKQACMDTTKGGHRAPPPGWEAAAAKLARRKADQFKRLADKLAG